MAQLSINDISISFAKPDGQRMQVLSHVSLEIEPGSFTSLVGPSGCGKSTLLQIMAGLLKASQGSAAIDGHPYDCPPHDALYVFQQYSRSLMPWLTVRD